MTTRVHPHAASPRTRNLMGRRFRANPSYELVEHRRLPLAQREAFEGLQTDPDHYGLLVPREHRQLGVMAIDADSASLFLSLCQASPLPADVRRRLGANGDRRIARLVLDGVLEIECNGGLATGPSSAGYLFQPPLPDLRPLNSVAALSYEALQWAERLPIEDPGRLSSWLYGFGCLPASPSWQRRLGSRERIDDALGLRRVDPLRRILEDEYSYFERPSWRFWRLSGAAANWADEPAYKLYISPHPDALGAVFRTTVRCLVEAEVPAFKLGSDLYGLLRPDKLIAYLDDRRSLERLGASLMAELVDCPAHGVPFTAVLDGEGLLSWGVDPPRSARIPGWDSIESWRLWVTNRLSRALLRARELGSGELEPWRYAILRLGLEGVGTESWLPSPDLWSEGEDAS